MGESQGGPLVQCDMRWQAYQVPGALLRIRGIPPTLLPAFQNFKGGGRTLSLGEEKEAHSASSAVLHYQAARGPRESNAVRERT